MEAERRLKEAEESLHKLGIAVEHHTPSVHHEVKEEMVVNVNKLKRKIYLSWIMIPHKGKRSCYFYKGK